MPPLVRTASPSDAQAMGEVHVRAWRAAYRGILSDALLDGLTASKSAEGWARAIAGAGDERVVLVAEDEGRVVGFAGGGPAVPEGEDGRFELYVLNVDPARWSRGLGGALLDRFVAWTSGRGERGLMLRVARDNARARRFYERRGWAWDGTEASRELLGDRVVECRYRRSGVIG